MEKRKAWIIGILLFVMLGGCAVVEHPGSSVTGSEIPVNTPETSQGAGEEFCYALAVNGKTYEVDLPFSSEGLFTAEECREEPEDFPWPASRNYRTDTMTAQTFLQEDGSETLVSLTTWGEGKTPEGIGVGSALEELKAAYPGQLVLLDGIFGTGHEGNGIAYERMYTCYDAKDGTNKSYCFYLKEKKVVMLQVSNQLDSPRDWYGYESPLGMEELHWEYLLDEPQTHVHYFAEQEDGSETTVLDIHGAAEHHDLDDDGVLEVLTYLEDGNVRGIGIYDLVDGEIIFTDVSQTLGLLWSGYMGNVANLPTSEYDTCVYGGTETGKSGDVYSYSDGVLTYECTFTEAMS